MPNEIETGRRRIIVDKPLDSVQDSVTWGAPGGAEISSEKEQSLCAPIGNDNTTTKSRDVKRDKKRQEQILAYELNKKLDELYSKGKLIHTDIRYYVEVLGIDIGDIQVNVHNYLEVLLAADKEAKRRGFLF